MNADRSVWVFRISSGQEANLIINKDTLSGKNMTSDVRLIDRKGGISVAPSFV